MCPFLRLRWGEFWFWLYFAIEGSTFESKPMAEMCSTYEKRGSIYSVRQRHIFKGVDFGRVATRSYFRKVVSSIFRKTIRKYLFWLDEPIILQMAQFLMSQLQSYTGVCKAKHLLLSGKITFPAKKMKLDLNYFDMNDSWIKG